MKIKILHFLHEKIFRHDKGREPNKFTNFVYFLLMPICYLSERNTMLRYDWNRDVFIIDKMEFSHALLKTIYEKNTQTGGLHGFNVLAHNYLSSRPYGKQYSAFLKCVTQIEAGQNTAFVGLKWMVISTDYYRKLIDRTKITVHADDDIKLAKNNILAPGGTRIGCRKPPYKPTLWRDAKVTDLLTKKEEDNGKRD